MNSFYLNSLCYTIGWFWCLHFGSKGSPYIAAFGALSLIIVQLANAKSQNGVSYTKDLLLALFSLPLGIGLEMGLVQSGWLSYPSTSSLFPPIWIVILYPLFSLLLNHSLSFLKRNYFIAFAVGFLAAPLSYFAGQKMGGAVFPQSIFSTWMVIGTLWGLFLALLTALAKVIDKAADKESATPIKLLYDGECPLCQREITFLKKRAENGKVIFIDISSPLFSSKENEGIDYIKAMTEIHAIDSRGTILIGVPAFAELYARCHLPILATLMRIPFIEAILTPFYKLFAKNRLRITRRCPLPPKN